jgi:ribosome maturation factor RimP
MATMLQRLDEIIAPIVTDLGLELFDLEFTSSTIRVTIDKAPVDGRPVPIDLSDITAVTRAVSRALDEHDPIAERYSLEVSSPGLERTLRTPVHFERALGQTVSIKTVPSAELERRLKGRLVRVGTVGAPVSTAAGDAPHTIDIELDDGDIRTVAYADIDKARTVFEWGPESRPTKPKPKTKTKAGSTTGSATQPKKPKKKKVDAT